MSEYISTMVDWDHSTGESAKVSAPATPPPKARIPDGSTFRSDSGSSAAASFATKSWAERQMSMAVQPAANAPATAEKQLIAQAGVGWPM